MAAAAAQDQPAQHRNVVVSGNRLMALRARGARRDHGQATWKPVNADVQKTAEDQAEGKKLGSQ